MIYGDKHLCVAYSTNTQTQFVDCKTNGVKRGKESEKMNYQLLEVFIRGRF